MEKKILAGILAGVLFSSLTGWSKGFEPGTYQGEGRWNSASGGTGTYSVSTRITGDQVRSEFLFAGQSRVFEFQAKMGQNDFFTVTSEGQTVGSGYCLFIQCHYDLKLGKTRLEETLTFYQDNLYRLGSKKENGMSISWIESLAKETK